VGYTTDMEFHHFLKKPRFLERKLGKELHSAAAKPAAKTVEKLSGELLLKFRFRKARQRTSFKKDVYFCAIFDIYFVGTGVIDGPQKAITDIYIRARRKI
jgi:hypothetical protein